MSDKVDIFVNFVDKGIAVLSLFVQIAFLTLTFSHKGGEGIKAIMY